VLTRVDQRRPDLRIPFPPGFARRLRGRRIEAVRRRAKYILVDLDNDEVLVIHLGMSGRICLVPSPGPVPGPHDHVLFHTDDGTTVVFNDARRFGLMTIISRDALPAHPLFRDLGPEPLGNAFNGPALSAALAGRLTPIKVAILDQKVVVGVGNIYACESLFRAGISPRRRAASVAGRRAERLAAAIKAVLREAIEAGGSSLRDYVQASGELGYFQHNFAVYGREGEPCPGCDCGPPPGGGIRRIVQAGRSTYYCPKKQR
jgi:formamidopyrimidine-DNA glycosylase